MDQIPEFIDKRHKTWCIHCNTALSEVDTNMDHVPSRSLLNRPFPKNLPTIEICRKCNNRFSGDEEYLAVFLKCVLAGSTDPEDHDDRRATCALKRHKKLRARIEKSRMEYQTLGGDIRLLWKPEMPRIDRIVLKNARGHAFYEYGEPMLNAPSHVRSIPLTTFTAAERQDFESGNSGVLAEWPEVGSRMMTRVISGQDTRDGWVKVQDAVYRYRVTQEGGILVRSVLCEYLATEVLWEL